ncbi:MAG: hemolysin family protein [Rickettsiales bacterium]|jgi:CBS domain containing-hemolysin-like protein|nr:hemolysin family protein [Rickettsiales bacterium]
MNHPSDAEPLSKPTLAVSNARIHASERKSGTYSSLRLWIRTLFGGRQEATLKEVLDEVIEEHEEHSEERLEPEEKVMLHNVLSFGDTQVHDIMVPRTDIESVPIDIPLPALKTHIMEHRHTRIPVYEDTLDHVRGFVHVKDLLPMFSGDQPYSLTSVMRTLLFVPPSMRIVDLLSKMRHAGSHMAMVVDEYGGTDGLVTLEDVVEEIIGEIRDEHDEGEEATDRVHKHAAGVYDVSARISIESIEKALGLNVVTEEKEEEFDTLGGLIFFQLGRVPVKGEVINHVSGVRFEVLEADARRIHKVRIHTTA